MKIFKLFLFLTISLIFILSCADKPVIENQNAVNIVDNNKSVPNEPIGNDWWHCPDNIKGFPPIDIKLWNTVPVVNGRPPTYEETENGTSLIYYGLTTDTATKPYNMFLPKLASFYNPNTKKIDTVVVIQIVQSSKDTVVGYRYITGGNGTHKFRNFHFLTDSEVKKAVRQ